jgi:hypothetical protein
LFTAGALQAQAVKKPVLTDILQPVTGENGTEDIISLYECASSWGDYNNDGFFDLLVSGIENDGTKRIMLYKNSGIGTFSKVETPFFNLQNASAVWLDYNNDGNLDLFLAGTDNIGKYAGLYKNTGQEQNYTFEEVYEGAFEPLYNGGGNQGNRYAIAGDYDNDGWTDIYIQGRNEGGIYASLYRNEKGNGFFLQECPVNGTQPFLPLYANTAAFADFNNDGYLDLLTGGYATLPNRSCTGAYYQNNGNGTFAEPVLFAGGVNGEVAWLDYNNDGRQDFIITGYSFLSGIGWQGDLFENNDGNSFKRILPSKTKLGTTQDCSIACGDVNNDGYEDVLYLYSHPNALYLNNSGNQTFTKADLKYRGQAVRDQRGGMVNLVDFDRDNDLDVFTMGYGDTNLPALLRNDLGNDIPVNMPPTAPNGLNVEREGNGKVRFTWNASSDDLTPEAAIRYNLFVQKEGHSQTLSLLPADLSSGALKVNETLAPLTTTFYPMIGLEDGDYTLGVQAIDNAKLTSPFTLAHFTVGGSGLTQAPEEEIIVHAEKNALLIHSQTTPMKRFSLYNMQGIVLENRSGSFSGLTVNNLNKGVYIMRIKTEYKSIVKKIIL